MSGSYTFVSDGIFEPAGAMEGALHDMGKRPTWVGLAFSMIYQFARAEDSTGIGKNLFAANVSGSPELVGRNTACRLIAGFVNWLDALCGSAAEYTKAANDISDIRDLVMAVLDKCGFGESDQEGVVKTIQDFALDVYNNLCGEEKQIVICVITLCSSLCHCRSVRKECHLQKPLLRQGMTSCADARLQVTAYFPF